LTENVPLMRYLERIAGCSMVAARLAPSQSRINPKTSNARSRKGYAQAEVSVRPSENGKSVTAKGADPDTLVASANAYLGALNKLMVKRQHGKPETMVVP
jgi:2-isopropylmalate synthase